MIYKLRSKFIKICMLSILLMFFIIFSCTYLLVHSYTNHSLDTLADMISEHNGSVPEFNEDAPRPPKESPSMSGFFNRETPFTTRYFTVSFDKNNHATFSNTKFIASVTKTEAIDMAATVLSSGKERGWSDEYRYRVYETENGSAVIFINGAMSLSMSHTLMLSVAIVLFISGLIMLFFIILMSKYAVRPAAESYARQKRFITDANHELKTPLTLILTNIDIAEAELGKNEWLDDIRSEGQHMSLLVKRLISMARMDEDTKLDFAEFNLSDAVSDTANAFLPLAQTKGLSFLVCAGDNIRYRGNESAIRQMISILVDNAVKYCDADGSVSIEVTGKRKPIIRITNSCSTVSQMDLNLLFERFYRADKSRSSKEGFGIGLSIAKAVVEKHNGEIKAKNLDNNRICFQIRL